MKIEYMKLLVHLNLKTGKMIYFHAPFQWLYYSFHKIYKGSSNKHNYSKNYWARILLKLTSVIQAYKFQISW